MSTLSRMAGGEAARSGEIAESINLEELTPLVQRYSTLFTWRADDRDELAQEALVRVWEFRERYNPCRGSVQHWVFGVVRNSARELWRLRRRESALQHRLDREQIDEAGQDRQAADDLRRIRGAMLELSARDQQLLFWRYWERLSYRDIARLLGSDERAARQAGRRAVARLGRHLR